VHLAVLLTVIAASGATVVHLAATHDTRAAAREGAARVRPEPQATRDAAFRFERLGSPSRTVVRGEGGVIVATFTDGARTVVLTGPTRTFREPTKTPAAITTTAWVRLLPQAWQQGAEGGAWFRPWLDRAIVDRGDDVLAVATQYLDGAPPVADDKGVRVRGDASFRRDSDFADYLGVSWTFEDGTTEPANAERLGALDPAGFVRLVYGFRLGYPLRGATGQGRGLPRTAAAMAGLDAGTVIIADRDTTATDRLVLQPGDLLFFDARRLGSGDVDHVGIFLGLDENGHPRFVSSRKKADGPTFGDDGSISLLEQGGRFGQGLRSARRL
jgi:cell wall-associated NlpC family hydrolase